jgi:hypothetical protein
VNAQTGTSNRTALRLMICITIAAVALAVGAQWTRAAPVATKPAWFVGQWILASDEDGGPPGQDLDEFLADGHYIIYGPKCTQSLVASYHVHDGDIYVTAEVPGKGPIAMIFRPSADQTSLTYTSPRTRHNAIYRRALPTICPHS